MTNGASPLIEVRKLSKLYQMGNQEIHALRDLDLVVKKGEYMAVMGPSGSGKSTLMNILGCLDVPSSGKYLLENRLVSRMKDIELARERNRSIGFVFQMFNLLPRITAYENVMLPLLYSGTHFSKRREVALRALEDVDLIDRKDHRPTELSGGQNQKVAIARAIVMEPSLILADEPTGNLDSKTGNEIMQVFSKLNGKGHTVIVVTHEDEIARNCKRQLRLRDGRKEEDFSS